MHIPIFNKRRPLIFDIKLSKRKYKLVFLVDCCSNLQITISNNKYIISVCQIPSKATYNVSSAQKIEIFGSFGKHFQKNLNFKKFQLCSKSETGSPFVKAII